jgi:hypothetical protein
MEGAFMPERLAVFRRAFNHWGGKWKRKLEPSPRICLVAEQAGGRHCLLFAHIPLFRLRRIKHVEIEVASLKHQKNSD